MSRRLGVLIGLALAVVAVVVIAWTYRLEILLEVVEIQQHRDVGPPRPIEWDSGPDPAGRSEATRPPNIVVILADDLGWNDLSWLGGGVAGGTVPTPNIDSLARDGVHFANGYAANGTCAPSRAALMTGRYGTRFGFEFTPTPASFSTMVPLLGNTGPGVLRTIIVEDVGPSIPYDDMGVPASEITLAELLKPAGYHNVHIGKWHLGRSGGMAPHDQGFDESLLMASGLYLPENHPDVVNSKQDFDGIDRFLWRAMHFAASFNGGPEFEPGGYLTDYYTEQAVRVIEANRDRPFFLYLAHWAVHTPLQALKADYDALSHIEEHRLRVYASMVRSLDRSVGRVLAALRENGVEENTLVFFTSDNGAPAYIGLPRVNEPFRGWKISFFEGGIHVPYFLKWPARLPGGQMLKAPVHGFDIFATAAAAAGVEPPGDRTIDGVDLVPFVTGEVDGIPHDRLFWRTGGYQVVLADGYKLQINDRAPYGRVEDDSAPYGRVEDPPGRTWLFHLPSDPTEQRNLADAAPDRVVALMQLLAEHNAQQAAPLWPSAVASPINIDKTLLDPDAPDDEFIYWFN